MLFRCSAIALCLLLSTGEAQAQTKSGYLAKTDLPAIMDWVPAPPATGSIREAADLDAYLASRALVTEPRGATATADNVYAPKDVILRFRDALGFDLNDQNAPRLVAVMDRVMLDEEATLAPMKQPVTSGGRIRPYVRFASLAACPHGVDDSKYGLAKSGSYPSGHALLSWTWALLLAEAVPSRSNQLMTEGYQFGESRLVCGFHFPSDLEAGRYVASALVARLHADTAFARDWDRAKREIAKAERAAPPK